MFSNLIPGYELDSNRARFVESNLPRLPYGVRPLPANLWTKEEDPTIVKIYDGVSQDHERGYYRVGVVNGGYPVKIHTQPGEQK